MRTLLRLLLVAALVAAAVTLAPADRAQPVLGAVPAPRIDVPITSWRELYAPHATLSPAETAALKARRAAATAAIQARIAAGGAEIVPEVQARIADATGSREALVLIGGLGGNPSTAAVDALAAIYEDAALFRLREEALRALGESAGEGATDVLVAVMTEAEDPRLGQIATQELAGDAAALGALTAAVRDPSLPINTRLEAIPSIGAIGSAEATAALATLAEDDALEPRVRTYARTALARAS